MAVRKHGLFRLLPTPPGDAAKGACYITHTAGPCVDTGVLIDFEGTLCISVGTIKELAEVAGFSVNEEAVQLEQDNAFLTAEVSRLTTQVSELHGVIDGFAKAIAHAETAP